MWYRIGRAKSKV